MNVGKVNNNFVAPPIAEGLIESMVPKEIFSNIFSYLDQKALKNAMQVNRNWHVMAVDAWGSQHFQMLKQSALFAKERISNKEPATQQKLAEFIRKRRTEHDTVFELKSEVIKRQQALFTILFRRLNECFESDFENIPSSENIYRIKQHLLFKCMLKNGVLVLDGKLRDRFFERLASAVLFQMDELKDTLSYADVKSTVDRTLIYFWLVIGLDLVPHDHIQFHYEWMKVFDLACAQYPSCDLSEKISRLLVKKKLYDRAAKCAENVNSYHLSSILHVLVEHGLMCEAIRALLSSSQRNQTAHPPFFFEDAALALASIDKVDEAKRIFDLLSQSTLFSPKEMFVALVKQGVFDMIPMIAEKKTLHWYLYFSFEDMLKALQETINAEDKQSARYVYRSRLSSEGAIFQIVQILLVKIKENYGPSDYFNQFSNQWFQLVNEFITLIQDKHLKAEAMEEYSKIAIFFRKT